LHRPQDYPRPSAKTNFASVISSSSQIALAPNAGSMTNGI
jgi:hypothetical protein